MASATTVFPTTLAADAIAFADEQNLSQYLHLVLDMTARLFPEASRIEAVLEHDPELTDDRHIVFEVTLASKKTEHLAERHWQWSRELFDICPATQVCYFGLHVQLANA